MSTSSNHSPPSQRGDGWAIITATIAVFALIVAGIAFGANRDGSGTSVESAAPPVFEGPALEVDIELGELYIEPSVIEVEAGRPMVLTVTNAGVMDHDLALATGEATAMLKPGESEVLEVDGLAATTQGWCTVAGHRAGGMEMTFEVIGGATDVPVASGDHSAHGGSGDGNATLPSNPAWEPDFKPYDPRLAPAPGGTEHEITLRATETQLEVAPGVFQEVWTFDDMVPGPTLRGKVGDIFTVTIVNEGEIAHSMDFHASRVAWNDKMRNIAPGESLVYQFEAQYAGIWMYHCGTAPALHHIGNGMFGAVVIDPPDLAPVDHEFIFVQSEWYFGPQGEPGDLTKMLNDEWDVVVFNGQYNQYAHEPIRVEKDERIRAWVLDAGPSENSAFHIVGTIFDTFYKEGAYHLRPGDGSQGGSQALDLQPAQGGFVEFSFAEEGLYPIVTHKFSNASKGAMGMFQAGENFETQEGMAH